MPGGGKGGLSRSAVKYLAAAAMVLNHIASIFPEPGSFWSEAFLDIGYLAAPVMCCFLTEGYRHTRSRKKYALRLLLFGLLSQPPFMLAFAPLSGGAPEFCGFNIFFTLLICLGILAILERMREASGSPAAAPERRREAGDSPAAAPERQREAGGSPAAALGKLPGETGGLLAIGALFFCSAFCDWGILAPLFVLLLTGAGDSQREKERAFFVLTVVMGLMTFGERLGTMPAALCGAAALGSMAGPALAGLLVLWFYNREKQGRTKGFSKWFFYVFYPAHLLVLGLLRLVLILGGAV